MKDIKLFLDKATKVMTPRDFFSISIAPASPQAIRSWAWGEVKKPDTINYKQFRPERDGLFCERIFGPSKNWECYCGKYKGMKYNGVICDRCGVEVTTSDVRRKRMGYIELACRVVHIWYFKITPSPIALLLDISQKDLEKIIYYESKIVTDSGNTPLTYKQILSDLEYQEAEEKYSGGFKALSGGDAIKKLLADIDLKEMISELKSKLKEKPNEKELKRLEVAEAFYKSKTKPEWMVLEVLPVLPPDLRPMVQLESGRFASSDLNDLYRRVINRNNRLKRLISLKVPEVILKNEKRMLQESVDALLDNQRKRKPVVGPGNRALKSLSDLLKGKEGRFRQNLLGKRVDYSGRSVIVVDPQLKLYQAGLPKRIALELFKPVLIRKLLEEGYAHNIKSACKIIEMQEEDIYKLLLDIVKNYSILLNRAPTLHRLGIQAFEPVLSDDDTIKIPPLVCVPYNADFDGDQMAVHLPLSVEAQLESRLFMVPHYNLLSPAHGKCLFAPTQDMIVGLYFLTLESKNQKGEGMVFGDYLEVQKACELGILDLHAKITFKTEDDRKVETTPGRVIFNSILPKEVRFVNKVIDKKEIDNLILKIYRKCGSDTTARVLDNMKELGFHIATTAGITFSIDDLIPSQIKQQIIQKGYEKADKINQQFKKNLITEEERYNQVIDIWTWAVETISEEVIKRLKEHKNGFNPIYLMMISGARGNRQQVRQLSGVRGLMAKPSGEIIEIPIFSNFKDGLSIMEYFISTHGARKGLADTALKTADAGYLTRRLVDAIHEVVITQEDCGTLNGVVMESLRKGEEVIVPLSERILGRISLDDIINPHTGELIARANEIIDEEKVQKIGEADIERVRIRSVLTCEARRGICKRCYGWNLSTRELVDVGEPVGIIAAQSIGEPGTQLTMRTFHIGGTAFKPVEEREVKFPYKVEIVSLPPKRIQHKQGYEILKRSGNLIIRKVLYELSLEDVTPIAFDGLWVNINDKIALKQQDGNLQEIKAPMSGVVRLVDSQMYIMGRERNIFLPTGTKLFVKENQIINENTLICEIDPFNEPIISDVEGRVRFKDIVMDKTLKEELDETTGLYRKKICEDKEGNLQPRIIIYPEEGSPITYFLPSGSILAVNEGSYIEKGGIIAKFPQEVIRTKDITGGLPLVVDLFEARRPKNPGIIAEIDGVVEIKDLQNKKRQITIRNPQSGEVKSYIISTGRYLMVHDGEHVKANTQLTDGNLNPHDILRIAGEKELQRWLLSKFQEIYKSQGITINDKHFEVVIHQMLRKVEIVHGGDTDFVVGELVDKFKFLEENEKIISRGGKPARAKPVLLSITKVALLTDSFISAASFQETTRVLARAALENKEDYLYGLKENVICGRLIPAGTGFRKNRENIEIVAPE